jgi:hypothetical protein
MDQEKIYFRNRFIPIFRDKRGSLPERATLTRNHAGVCSLGFGAPRQDFVGRRVSFCAMPSFTQLAWPFQNGLLRHSSIAIDKVH